MAKGIFSFIIQKHLVVSLIFLAILTDIIFFLESSDFVIFGILGVYVGCVWFAKIKSNITFLFCLLFLLLMYGMFLFTETSVHTEKAAVWFFLFFVVGIFQKFKE